MRLSTMVLVGGARTKFNDPAGNGLALRFSAVLVVARMKSRVWLGSFERSLSPNRQGHPLRVESSRSDNTLGSPVLYADGPVSQDPERPRRQLEHSPHWAHHCRNANATKSLPEMIAMYWRPSIS